jgi:hypothetical protein
VMRVAFSERIFASDLAPLAAANDAEDLAE